VTAPTQTGLLRADVANTIAMEGFWSATSAGQTVTGSGSTLTRKGP
jgi:hypothetical protein